MKSNKLSKFNNSVKTATKKTLEKIKNFFIKAELPLLYVLVALLTFVLRQKLFYNVSGDYKGFLKIWIDQIRKEGVKQALSHKLEYCDYPPAYMYILAIISKLNVNTMYSIKVVSCFFDLVLAVFIALSVKDLTKNKFVALASFSVTLLLPSIFSNSASWAQCDVIYSAFCVMMVYFLLKNKPITAIIMYGIAFSFKLQAIFIAPLLAVLYFKRKIPLWSPLLVVGIYFLSCVPSLLCGRELGELLKIYIDQTKEYTGNIVLNAPSFSALFNGVHNVSDKPELLNHIGSSLTILTITVTIILIYFFARHLTYKKECLVDFGFCFSLTVPYFLPYMHERYFYLAVVTAIIYVAVHPKRFMVLILQEFCSFVVTVNYLYGQDKAYITLGYLALIELGLVIFTLYSIWKDYRPVKQASQPLLCLPAQTPLSPTPEQTVLSTTAQTALSTTPAQTETDNEQVEKTSDEVNGSIEKSDGTTLKEAE